MICHLARATLPEFAKLRRGITLQLVVDEGGNRLAAASGLVNPEEVNYLDRHPDTVAGTIERVLECGAVSLGIR